MQDTRGREAILRLRIEADIKAKAKSVARAHGRTLSQHVRELLRADIAQAIRNSNLVQDAAVVARVDESAQTSAAGQLKSA